jgi:hypothetical protein
LIPIPGFEDAPVALAGMQDGTVLVLDFGGDEDFRVAGSFIGPIGPMETANDWAAAGDSESVTVYQVTRSEQSDKCCG